MRATVVIHATRSFFLSLVLLVLVSGCRDFSEHIGDKSAGLNGGFEVSRNGLPVNWLMYTPNTVPDSDFRIVLDQERFKEGTTSLRFDVKKCSGAGGWRSPGFTNEFFDLGKFEGEARYKLSFWVMNDGATFSVTAGGVSAKTGSMRTLIREGRQIDEWTQFEHEVDVPEEDWLRMELNVLKPGTFWIDDVRIERI